MQIKVPLSRSLTSLLEVTSPPALHARFDPIPGHGLPLRGFAITHIGHTTLSGTPLDE
jgi:hypothetical protein